MPEEESDEYRSPEAKGNIYLAEHFDDVAGFNKKWVRSEAKKDEADELIAKYDGKYTVVVELKVTRNWVLYEESLYEVFFFYN